MAYNSTNIYGGFENIVIVKVGLSFFSFMNYFMRFKFCGTKVIPFIVSSPKKVWHQ